MTQPAKGWIALYRKFLDHPRYRDSEFVHVWIHLLLSATHKPIKRIFAGKEIELQPGQLITGRHALSAATGVEVSKVNRVLQRLKAEQQIEQRTSNACSLITILNWKAYQKSEQPLEQQANSQRTAARTENEQPFEQRITGASDATQGTSAVAGEKLNNGLNSQRTAAHVKSEHTQQRQQQNKKAKIDPKLALLLEAIQ